MEFEIHSFFFLVLQMLVFVADLFCSTIKSISCGNFYVLQI